MTEAQGLQKEKELSSLIPLSVHAAYRVPDWSYEREDDMRTTAGEKEKELLG